MSAPSTSTAPASPTVPRWVRHYLTGVTAIVTGMILLHYGDAANGEAAIVAGLAFLGVGAGASTASPS